MPLPAEYTAPTALRSLGPNVYSRFHQVTAWLQHEAFVTCVGSWQCDETPHIFVKGDWLTHLHVRSYNVFALIDAVGVKAALVENKLTREGLLRLRERLDELAGKWPQVSFVSFADSVLLKSNWTVGHYESTVKYTFEPELLLYLYVEVQAAYRDILGLNAYGVFTQGSNEYHDDGVTHVSKSGNHISLNSLGLPIAQLMAIDDAARAATRSGVHTPADLYMDKQFYRSLQLAYAYQKMRSHVTTTFRRCQANSPNISTLTAMSYWTTSKRKRGKP
ncbi:hypothetical protein NB311A_04464 [Nitrobacter sp. Nb-311A]|uniref:hypothetical protein n=1 Tax=Nitrobacter sp. Nb-311A TaxID=314253 RepID=UPI0000686312|nr:hypothetical protein [Nitrobacter sp. Nb-311A]EAQ37534.1 hypothetical protein NB311A_04464 [Nitrobacter sp. Nb-311A]